MKKVIISKKEFQKKLLDLLNFRLIGIQIWIPEKDSIVPSELGGYLFIFNVSTIEEPGKSCEKLEVHVNRYGKLLLQLIDGGGIAKSLYWYDYFKSIKDLEKNIEKVKEILKAA